VVDDPETETPQSELRQELREQALTLERRRTHRFLWAQTWIVTTIGVVFVFIGPTLLGLPPWQAERSGWMSLLVLAMTLLAWRIYARTEEHGRIVLGLLYADAIVGTAGFYAIGEYETPNLAMVCLLVFMAPLFGDKRHAWGIATLEVLLYAGLLGLRAFGELPYDSMLPVPIPADVPVNAASIAAGEMLRTAQLANEGFLGDSFMGFCFLVYGSAFLAGEASLGLLTSQQDLEDEVERATRKLSRANAELQDRNRALDEFNAALSHDLKSPLSTALLSAETLIYGKPDLTPDQRKLADTIVNSTSRMGDLTRELLKLSRMTDVLGDGEPVDLGTVFQEAIEDLGERLLMSHAEIMVAGELPTALANPNLIREVAQNLIENAIKYGHSDAPRIRVEEARSPWGRVAFAVEDNGPGIPEDQRHLIFRPFLRLNRDQHRAEGVGAGLAIVQRIISVHGGSIRVEDGTVLKGARFVVELSAYGALGTLQD